MLDAEKPGEGLAPSHRPRVSSGEQQEYLEDNTAKGFDQASPPPRDRGRGMSTIEHAMELARNHIPVFPCRPDKSPYTDHGFKDASTDLRMVRRLFGPRPDALIGVPTGHRFDVLDIDVKHFEPVEWLKACEPEIPRTRTHRTRSGGLHYLFKPSRRFRNTISKIERGVDTKAKGGYVIWWPSEGHPVFDGDLLADIPEWLLDLVKPEERQERRRRAAAARRICRTPSIISCTTGHRRPSSAFCSARPMPPRAIVNSPTGGAPSGSRRSSTRAT